MVDKILSPDLVAALDRFINEQHPDLSRYEALKLAFRDWAIGNGYLDSPVERDDTPADGRTSISHEDSVKAGSMFDHFIAAKAENWNKLRD